MDALPSTERFSDRVADYVRFRPGYPDAAVDALIDAGALRPASVVADLASGTGISSELFLRRGCEVYAVEPNAAMRAAAERQLADHRRFHSVNGTAEATTLPDGSVDLVVAAQAFHWFDPMKTRTECLRILRAPRWAAILWNDRLLDATPFLRAYEAVLQTYGTDYQQVRHNNVTDATLRAFFGVPFELLSFPNEQVLDFEGIRGRLLSSSYVPGAGDPRRMPMLDALRQAFDAHGEGGRVRLLYETRLYLGRLESGDSYGR